MKAMKHKHVQKIHGYSRITTVTGVKYGISNWTRIGLKSEKFI